VRQELVLPFNIANIPGWTLPLELRFLYDEAVRTSNAGVEGALLEVGCWLGRSTYVLAQAGHVDVVDTFTGSFEIEPKDRVKDQLGVFSANMTRLGVGRRTRAFRGQSWFWLQRLDGPYRLIFIDGGHDYPTVRSDLELSLKLLAPGGTLVVDDVNQTFPGVQQAVRDVLANQVGSVGKMGVWHAEG
jgi:predicted O-methyltransferase YrrM